MTPTGVAATTASPSRSARPSRTVKVPPAHAVFDYQIGGAYAPGAHVAIVDRDRADRPVPGRYNICYVNAFQTQPTEASWWKGNHGDLLLRRNGRYVEDPDWPGELILDISTDAKRAAIATVVGGWFAGCADRGFDAVEPDNLDSWTRSHGGLTQADAVAMVALLADSAHRHGLAIGQKNASELGTKGKHAGLDFAIAEECGVYDECGDYVNVYGDHVIDIEYTDNGNGPFAATCAAYGKRLSVILRDREVVAAGQPGYHYQTC